MEQFESQPEQRMSDTEAQEVLRILAERQREREEMRGRPSVHDVAALANAPITDVYAALGEIRARSIPVQAEAVRKVNRVWIVPAAAIGALMLGLMLLIASPRPMPHRPTIVVSPGIPAPPPPPPVIFE